jgi:thiol:disulfide interchange protein
MKKSVFIQFLLFFFLISSLHAQILKPAKWHLKVSKEEVKVGDTVDLIFSVDIQKDWYLYSSDFEPDQGPMVTTFSFVPHKGYELVGGIKPVNPKKKFDEMFEMDITYFTGKAEFRQTIKVLDAKPVIKGTYAYQVCTDVEGKCIPFDDDFHFTSIKVIKENVAGNEAKGVSAEVENQVTVVQEGKEIPASEPAKIKVNLPAQEENMSLWAFMAIAFMAGMAALITPCVFPMIPMTVTFFTKSSPSRKQGIIKAIMYGLSIIIIYTLAGTVVAKINGPEFANWLSTHWLPNVFFFVVFVVFGLAFLGLFEITLPSSLVNKVDQQSEKGGFYGVFFMAFTLVLVSFSCTGPIVGSILVESAGGEILKPIVGMLGFSLAFAIPFTLFAIFPEWMKSLPSSGGWLNSVKVVLGFLELALALKFLSMADQVYHWNLLDRDVYIAIWITIFTLMGFYLLGKIRLPHDSELKSIGVPRLMLAIITFSFVVYLVPGLFGAPLKSLAGYLPPMTHHDFELPGMIRQSSMAMLADNREEDKLCEAPKYDFLHLPHGLKGYFDYDQALACAQAQGKPLFIDFTGHACVNCREMEARVWADPKVLDKLMNDFVVVALYVDEKTDLKKSEWYTSNYDGKVKKTLGKKNADLQISRFNNNAQPFYVILDHNENLLVEPMGYNKDVQSFTEFLEKGLENYRLLTGNVLP